jgi:hypothetical protein
MSVVSGWESARSGAAWPRDLCGRWVLKGVVALCEPGQTRSLIPVGQIASVSSLKAARTRRFATSSVPSSIVAAADVLDEGVPGADHPCATETFEAAHRP